MDTHNLSRRDFFKLAGLFSLSLSASRGIQFIQVPGGPNIFIIVFDAWSGHHLSALGYPRNTTPKLNKRLDKALVYHNHYSAGNSTTPGTNSLLTGTYSWTHRAFAHDAPPPSLIHHNLFNLLGNDYFRQVYTHNAVADIVLRAFRADEDLYVPRQQLFLTNDWINTIFSNDFDIASTSVEVALKNKQNRNSLFLRDLYVRMFKRSRQRIVDQYIAEFPQSPPEVSGHPFLLETAVDWLVENTPNQPKPFLSYFHLLPPHAPYQHTRAEFQGAFTGKMDAFLQKPDHILSQGQVKDAMIRDRNLYDNFILYADAEFDRLISEMEATGALEDTWVILTSDHGEMFERGIIGHTNPAMFAPLLHVPLFIFGPGVTQREDIFTPTSSLDLLPTIAQLAGRPIPDWAEGEVLPWFRTAPTSPDRSIYGINARHNDKFKPITHASISMLKRGYRLSAYLGYPELDLETRYELYDMANDPHEMEDIFAAEKQVAGEMVTELNDKLDEVNQPYLD